MPRSKHVVRQLAHEFRKSFLRDPNVFKGLDISQKELKMNRKSRFVDGFIQFLAHSAFLIIWWTQQDIELFHELGSVHLLVADATSNIAVKSCEKRIFYFSFVAYNRTIKAEPVPILEV